MPDDILPDDEITEEGQIETAKLLRTVEMKLEKQPPRRSAWPAWTLGLLSLAMLIGMVFGLFLPMAKKQVKLESEYDTALKDVARLVAEVEESETNNRALLANQVALEAVKNALESQRAELETDKGELQKAHRDLASELEAKTKVLRMYEQAQFDLEKRLKNEVKKGQVLIRRAQGHLVVDLMDKLMFDSAEVELNESGRDVLKRVAETLKNMPNELILIGGHTDNVPISRKMIERYPTNWELSAARAIGVVRFLQDECKIPGDRLAGVGYSEYRPAASNRSRRGRRRNRRIEVMLLPREKER
jgi:chemotaxis protein MotB